MNYDSGATVFDSNVTTQSTLQNFQFRIGGRYFPAAPVQCSTDTGSTISNGGAEAYLELAKAINVVGDYRLSAPVNTNRWALPAGLLGSTPVLHDTDYTTSIRDFTAGGRPNLLVITGGDPAAATSYSTAGSVGSQCFCMATALETTNGIEISGLNAEEQVMLFYLH